MNEFENMVMRQLVVVEENFDTIEKSFGLIGKKFGKIDGAIKKNRNGLILVGFCGYLVWLKLKEFEERVSKLEKTDEKE